MNSEEVIIKTGVRERRREEMNAILPGCFGACRNGATTPSDAIADNSRPAPGF